MLYLDHAATTPMRPEVWDAMAPYATEVFGNSSGVHGVSRRAKNALEEARELVAELLGARPLEIVFTAGGTEADNLALKGPALAGGKRGGVVVTAVEHEAVLESARFLSWLGCPVRIVGVDSLGLVEPEEVATAVDENTAVVSVMAANNETGVIEPVRAVAEAAKSANPRLAVHSDAVQAFISQELKVEDLGVDLMSLAAHKFGGPKGTGVLYVREGVALEPALHGGGQELGRRSGTHNVMGAVGMARAMELATKDRDRFRADVSEGRQRFEAALAARIPGIELNAPPEGRLVQHSHLRFPGIRNETLLVRLDQRGLAASAGSACQSGAIDVSHVLEAMGFEPSRARECVRFTFGWTSVPSDGDEAARVVLDAVEGLA
jgi:cysteine desulfurase